MRILFNELKRYMRPLLLSMIVFLSLCWYVLYGSDSTLYLGNDLGQTYKTATEYVNRFGTTIDENEIEVIRGELEQAESERDSLIDEYMGEYGIHTHTDYQLFCDEYYDKKESANLSEEEKQALKENFEAVQRIYWRDPVTTAVFRARSIYQVVEDFDFIKTEREALEVNDSDWFFYGQPEKNLRKLGERLEINELSVVSVLNPDWNFRDYYGGWGLLIFICCAVLCLPLQIRNKITNVSSLQFSSRSGKRLLRRQLCAALISGLMIWLVLTAVFLMFYFSKGSAEFLPCRLNLSLGSGMYWYDLTFRGYIITLCLKTAVIALCETAAVFWLSVCCKNYVTAIAAAVPVVALFNFINSYCVRFLKMFYGYPQWLFGLTLAGATALCAAGSVLLLRRERKADWLMN